MLPAREYPLSRFVVAALLTAGHMPACLAWHVAAVPVGYAVSLLLMSTDSITDEVEGVAMWGFEHALLSAYSASAACIPGSSSYVLLSCSCVGRCRVFFLTQQARLCARGPQCCSGMQGTQHGTTWHRIAWLSMA
jgi:hypothetical protein